jgi:hypothetical protein
LFVDNENIVLDSQKQLTSQAQFMSSQHVHQLADYKLVIRLAACRLDHVNHQWRRFAVIRPVQTTFKCHQDPCDKQSMISDNINHTQFDVVSCTKRNMTSVQNNDVLDLDIEFTMSKWLFGHTSTTMMTIDLDYRSTLSRGSVQYRLFRRPNELSLVEQLILTPVWLLVASVLTGTCIICIIGVKLIHAGWFKSNEKKSITVSESELVSEQLIPTPDESPLPHIKIDANQHAKQFLEGYTKKPALTTKPDKVTEI